jgi:hypothetical protein
LVVVGAVVVLDVVVVAALVTAVPADERTYHLPPKKSCP